MLKRMFAPSDNVMIREGEKLAKKPFGSRT
jgi:hypothetical protein